MTCDGRSIVSVSMTDSSVVSSAEKGCGTIGCRFLNKSIKTPEAEGGDSAMHLDSFPPEELASPRGNAII